MNDMNRKINEMKYNKQGRAALMTLWIASLVNIMLIFTAEIYFVFSSYAVTTLTLLGWASYGTGIEAFFIFFALIIVAMYFICWLLSKKHYGWMIAALVLFSLDTAFLLFDFVLGLAFGDEEVLYLIIDVVFHALILINIIKGVILGKAARKDGLPSEEEIMAMAAGGDVNAENSVNDEKAPKSYISSMYADSERTIKLQRGKAFFASALSVKVYIDGKEVAKVGNGQTVEFKVSGAAHEMLCLMSSGATSNTIMISAGRMNKNYSLKVKMGFTEAQLLLTEG